MTESLSSLKEQREQPLDDLFKQAMPRPGRAGGQLLNKPVETLAIVPKRERLTVLARKIYNVLMYAAQQQGPDQEVYVMSLPELAKAAGFNSKDMAIVKEHIAQLITTLVDWQSPTKGEGAGWKLSTLLAEASVTLQGGENFVRWSYSPTVRHEIMAPNRYSRISLLHQAAMRTVSGLALYEICMRYVNNPGGVTARQHWTWWRPVLTGSPEEQVDTYREYKYFKRDVLRGAVAEVNAITDLEVALIEHRQGRAIQDLQFSVKRKALTLVTAQPTAQDLPALGMALKEGVSQEQAQKLIAEHGSSSVMAGLKVLAERKADVSKPQIENPAGYLAAVVSNQQSQAPAEAGQATVSPALTPTVARATLIEQFRSKRRSDIQGLFKELGEADRVELLAAFEKDVVPTLPRVLAGHWGTKGIQNPMIRARFFGWYAELTWGPGWDEPTPEDMLELVSPT